VIIRHLLNQQFSPSGLAGGSVGGVGLFWSGFAPGSLPVMLLFGNSETYFNEGKRKVGLLFHGDLNKLGIDGVKQYHLAQLEYIGQQEYPPSVFLR